MRTTLSLVAVCLALSSSCSEQTSITGDGGSESPSKKEGDSGGSIDQLTVEDGNLSREARDAIDYALSGVSRKITPDELDVFGNGRALEDVLAALDWKGNFEFSYLDGGDEFLCMSYAVGPKANPFMRQKITVWAIFKNREFQRFVEWVGAKTEKYVYKGVPASRRMRLGVLEVLARAQKAVSAPRLELDKVRRIGSSNFIEYPESEELSRIVRDAMKIIQARQVLSLEENSRLRLRFNGIRVHTGESRSVIEEWFGQPLKTWVDGALTVCLYGSEVRFELSEHLHHAQVVVAYEGNIATATLGGEFVHSVVIPSSSD